jgi:hypothetical protein
MRWTRPSAGVGVGEVGEAEEVEDAMKFRSRKSNGQDAIRKTQTRAEQQTDAMSTHR